MAAPAEFAALLGVIDTNPNPADAVPFALAGYGSLRAQEIRALGWADVDFKAKALIAAEDERARKPGGSWRLVPLVAPLLTMLRRAWIAQGRPKSGKVCPPRRTSNSGLVSLDCIRKRAAKACTKAGLEPIGYQEARRTCATWLDHAGVSPEVASSWMGHKTPDYQPGAAAITLRRYTHTLPGELARARELVDRFLSERAQEAIG